MIEQIILEKLDKLLENFENVPKEKIVDIQQSYKTCAFTLDFILHEYENISRAFQGIKDVIEKNKNIRTVYADAHEGLPHERTLSDLQVRQITNALVDGLCERVVKELHDRISVTLVMKQKDELKQVADLITENIIGTQKEVLTSNEAATYLGVTKSCLYKWTMTRQIPHYKSPTGKMCFFNRKEIEAWMQSSKVATNDELEQQALKWNKKQ